MMFHVLNLLEQRGLADKLYMRQVMPAVEEQNGLAVDITREAPGPMAWP